MIDGRSPYHTDESVDMPLSRVLGSTPAPEEMKRRHLAAVQQSVSAMESPPWRRSIGLRLGASVAVALLLVAFVGLVMSGIFSRDDSGTTTSALAAAKYHFTAPPPVTGRHIEARFMVADPSVENTTEAFAEVWSRTQDDGEAQIEVLAWDVNRSLLGRTVETADGLWFDLDGELHEFGDLIAIKPITSLLLQVTFFMEFDQVIATVEGEYSDVSLISESTREGVEIVTIQFLEPRDPEDQAAFAEQFGTPSGTLGYEIVINSESGNPVLWEMFIRDSSERRHTVLDIEFERWEELAFDEIDDARFDMVTSKTSP